MVSSPEFTRLGVYFTPPKGPFAEFGASWLGWDIATGQSVAHPAMTGIPLPISIITAGARKYGFHATIMAPFRLAQGTTLADVEQALETLSKQMISVPIGPVTIAALGRFLAVVPAEQPKALTALAAVVVDQMDGFRAPLSTDDIARKDKPHLTDRQRANLHRFGHPYVQDDYRFHMTLTDKLSKPHLNAVETVLNARALENFPKTLILDALSLVGEDADGQFHLIRRYPLGAAGIPD